MASFRFQDLPRVARDSIYRELFVKPKVLSIHEFTTKAKSAVAARKSPSGLALLRTNKRIHQEGLQVLYGENKFVLEAPSLKPERISTMKKFLQAIGVGGRRCLKYLSLHLRCYRLRGQLNNQARLATLVKLKQTLNLLRDSWLTVLELSLDDNLFAEFKDSLDFLKIDESAIRTSPPFIPRPGLLKKFWGTRLVILGTVLSGKGKIPDANETPCKGNVYHSVFAHESLEIYFEYTRSDAESKDRFSALPSEIRGLIYDKLLIAKNEICALPASDRTNRACRLKSNKPSLEKHMTIALLRTSRLIHSETSPLLYGENVFYLASHEKNSITDWLCTIGTKNRRHLRYLRLDHDKPLRTCELSIYLPMDIPMIDVFASRLGSALASKTHELFVTLLKTATENVAEVAEAIAADYVSTLELLASMPGLSRLELIVPSHYHFLDDHDSGGPLTILERCGPCPALTKQTLEFPQRYRSQTS